MDDIGKVIDGRFELVQKLGEGGMGTVYRARHREMDRDVAIKLLKGSVAHSPEQQMRFRNEAKVISILNHPNIVTIYATGISDDGNPYIAMELLDGKPLSEIIATATGKLSAKDIVPLFIDVCEALAHAHQHSIIHRDIKPSNLIVTGILQQPEVKIVDFGIAKVLGTQAITRTNAVLGSAFYLSPGQAEGRTSDVQSDIYSLGCSLFEALAGKPPFVGDNYLQTLQQHQSSEPPKVKQINPDSDITPQLQEVITCCLEKDPQARYASVEALAADLHNVLSQRPPMHIPNKTDSAKNRRHRLLPRPAQLPAAIFIALVCGATIIALSGVQAWLTDSAHRERSDTLREAKEKLRLQIDAGRQFNIDRKFDQAYPILKQAWTDSQNIDDPMLEASAAIELHHSANELPWEVTGGIASSATRLLKAIRDLKSFIAQTHQPSTSAAHERLFICYYLLVVIRNAQHRYRDAVEMGVQALKTYDRSAKAEHTFDEYVFTLEQMISASLHEGNSKAAVSCARDAAFRLRKSHVEPAVIRKKLLWAIGEAEKLQDKTAVARLKAVLKSLPQN